MDAIGCQNHIADFTGSDAYLNNHDLGNASKIKDEFKMAGNTHFNAGDFEAAIKSYSNGLAIISPGLDDSTHTDISLLANRSAAYLNIGNYLASMADANTVLTRNPFHKKAIFRKSKCLFGLARYEEAVEFLQLKQKAMTSTEVFSLLENAKMYYRQQKFGEYRMSEMIQTKNCSRLNLADFIGQVEIVNNLSEEKGRSLIATENISAGDLLIACKAFDIVFPESDLEIDKIIQLKSSFCGKYLNSPGEMKLVESIQKLLTRERDPEKVKEFYKLYAGPELGYLPGDSLPAQIADLKRIEGICTFNGFAHGETIQSQFGLFENWGLWILPSYINHSCVDCNCTWRICGDFMFVRAFKSIRKGEEILISYLSPDGTYEKRKSIMDKHKFVCGCRLCQYENSMSDLERKRRKTLLSSPNPKRRYRAPEKVK